MSYCPNPLNFKCQIWHSYPHVQWFNCASKNLHGKCIKRYTQGSSYINGIVTAPFVICLRATPLRPLSILCLFVVPQPPGASSQCVSGHQGLHSERLQWQHHLQIPDQVSRRAGKQGKFQMRVWGDIWCVPALYVGAHPMRHWFFLKTFDCIDLKGIKLSLIFWNEKVNLNIL